VRTCHDPPTPETTTPLKVIALVSSVGGMDALTRVLRPLPMDFPAAIVALQHLSPDRRSTLAETLERRTALRVVRAEDGEMLAASSVYVVPEGRHMLVLPDGSISLIVSGATPPNRPSADLLLTTLAVSLRSEVIAVVLSGGGNDGATGATAVHDLGGVVIAADEASSQQFSMPEATIGRENAVDHVVHVDDIAAKLEELVAAHGDDNRGRPG
jgi:two-component system chemotaxis response regulator CheB